MLTKYHTWKDWLGSGGSGCILSSAAALSLAMDAYVHQHLDSKRILQKESCEYSMTFTPFKRFIVPLTILNILCQTKKCKHGLYSTMQNMDAAGAQPYQIRAKIFSCSTWVAADARRRRHKAVVHKQGAAVHEQGVAVQSERQYSSKERQ